MIRNGGKTVVLYLEDWQKRMVKDFLGVECDTYEVTIGKPDVIFRYGIPNHEESKRMYLTDRQFRQIKDEARIVCEFVELHQDNLQTLDMVPIS